MGTTTQTNPTPERGTISDNNQTSEDTHVVNDTRHGWVDRNPPPVVYPMEEGMLQEIKGRYKEDLFFQKILDMPRAFKNFELTSDGFIRLKLHDRDVLCIPDVKVGKRKLHKMVIDQAHSLLAHCHDCDIPPHPVHPQSRLHTALFALNSPHPNSIHIQTLSPLSLPSRALCSICDAYVSAHDALLFLSVSREHR